MLDREELEQLLEMEDRCAKYLELQDWKVMHPDPDIPEEELIPFSDPNEEADDETNTE